jgi:hypothetical protein
MAPRQFLCAIVGLLIERFLKLGPERAFFFRRRAVTAREQQNGANHC